MNQPHDQIYATIKNEIEGVTVTFTLSKEMNSPHKFIHKGEAKYSGGSVMTKFRTKKELIEWVDQFKPPKAMVWDVSQGGQYSCD